ncbi:cold-regulated protein 27 isoform X1 [Benincasa hispida]|uniref:cold-regulated protein 27 isoform X1 n=1 Tax=Benincasa hispida TaxID=102211 RepID=UPI00190173ED|nr:cold-regulated protein 27 isoform X1 [Benincasa hispida]
MGHSHTQSSISPPPLPDRRQSLMPPSASDSTRSISQSVSSSITLDGSNPFLYSHHSLQLDAEQTHWTDEKHRLYLDSLEASFVQGLHQHRRRHALSMEQKMHWKPFMPNISSSELMILQDASWQKANIGRNDPSLDKTADSPAILEDLWINRFPSAGKQCTPEIPDVLEECGSCSDRRHLRNTSNSCGSARSSQQIPPCCRDSNIIITEVSDQNFVDDHPRELSGGIPIAKRLKKVSSDSSGNDQVVPYKRSSQTS